MSLDHKVRHSVRVNDDDDDDDLTRSRPLKAARNNLAAANSNGKSCARFHRCPFHLRLVTFVLVLTSWIVPARLDEHDHQYKNNEEVILWMNTVGPYHNRQETYSYFSLPFCKGTKQTIGHYHETLGEALQVQIAFTRIRRSFAYFNYLSFSLF